MTLVVAGITAAKSFSNDFHSCKSLIFLQQFLLLQKICRCKFLSLFYNKKESLRKLLCFRQQHKPWLKIYFLQQLYLLPKLLYFWQQHLSLKIHFLQLYLLHYKNIDIKINKYVYLYNQLYKFIQTHIKYLILSLYLNIEIKLITKDGYFHVHNK